MAAIDIRLADLTDARLIGLLEEHLRDMADVSPPESCHALDVAGLHDASVTLWTVWLDNDLAGCGALKQLDPSHGEIKSMRTVRHLLRRGVAKSILTHILKEAQQRGYRRLSLETGTQEYFEAARRLYATFGFDVCEPFGDYRADPNSVFMTKNL